MRNPLIWYRKGRAEEQRKESVFDRTGSFAIPEWERKVFDQESVEVLRKPHYDGTMRRLNITAEAVY